MIAATPSGRLVVKLGCSEIHHWCSRFLIGDGCIAEYGAERMAEWYSRLQATSDWQKIHQMQPAPFCSYHSSLSPFRKLSTKDYGEHDSSLTCNLPSPPSHIPPITPATLAGSDSIIAKWAGTLSVPSLASTIKATQNRHTSLPFKPLR